MRSSSQSQKTLRTSQSYTWSILANVPTSTKCTSCTIHARLCFFFRNKHIMIDLGTGNNNKVNWHINSRQEYIDIIETVFRGARKGRGLVVSPKDYSTKYRY
mmetsp:Transcript_133/g.217  ORF Transcript_133/g.217 Transcript_133/m.217 type:complete len:102 (+) Transcript_133:203-508(+)